MAGCSRTFLASFLVFFVLFGFSGAKEILVGGGKEDAWKVPPSSSESLNKWAERARFQVGDHLVWKYDGGKDSVLQVSKEDYANCSTSNPIKQYNDGNTKVELDRPGPFYFISGAKGHCEQGEKLVVVVLSPRGGRYTGISPAPAPAPAAAPAQFEGPAVAPSSGGATALQGGLVVALGVLAMWLF